MSTVDATGCPHADALRTWGELGRTTARTPTVSWVPVKLLTAAAFARLEADGNRVAALLAESNDRLSPLEDPFHVDMGAHRWLAAEREESYSDWFAWVLEHLDSRAVLHVLDLADLAARLSGSSAKPSVRREVSVPTGHPGQTGRIDLVVRLGADLVVAVELKIGDADAADTAKGAGYSEWLSAQPGGPHAAVLVGTDGSAAEYAGGFRFRRWADVCLALRHASRALSPIIGAMTLALVGAIEQNLLGMRFVRGHPSTTAIGEHLEAWLGRGHD